MTKYYTHDIVISSLISAIPLRKFLQTELGLPEEITKYHSIYFCVFCKNPKKPTLKFYLLGYKEKTYFCFECRAKGNIFTLHKHITNQSTYEAYPELKNLYAPNL